MPRAQRRDGAIRVLAPINAERQEQIQNVDLSTAEGAKSQPAKGLRHSTVRPGGATLSIRAAKLVE
jgi:hypothetical protein